MSEDITTQVLACKCRVEAEVVWDIQGQNRVVRCPNCQLVYSSDGRPPEDQIRFYREQYWKQYPEEQEGGARENIYYHALDWIERYRSSPGSLVDVGCGPGAFLIASQQRGWKVRGYDPSRLAVAQARACGLEANEGSWPPCPIEEEQVEVVTMINVLDHLTDPFGALQEAWRILKPKGVLYIRVPNAGIHLPLAKFLSNIGLGHLPVVHLFGFTASTFRHHLPNLGFMIEGIKTAPPTRQDPYKHISMKGGRVRALLKELDRWGYSMSRMMGLDRKGYGLSLEVLARKHQKGKTE